jgi:hypothetical protein
MAIYLLQVKMETLFHALLYLWVCLDMDMKDQTEQINFRVDPLVTHFGQLKTPLSIAKDMWINLTT